MQTESLSIWAMIAECCAEEGAGRPPLGSRRLQARCAAANCGEPGPALPGRTMKPTPAPPGIARAAMPCAVMQAAYATSIAASFCGESAGPAGVCCRAADVLAADVVVARLATERDPEPPPQPAAASASRSAAPNTTRPADPFAAALTEGT